MLNGPDAVPVYVDSSSKASFRIWRVMGFLTTG